MATRWSEAVGTEERNIEDCLKQTRILEQLQFFFIEGLFEEIGEERAT